MARGENPHLRGEPDDGPATQREILAQFEAAIAGMRIREIQLGLRRLLAGSVPPPPTETGSPWAETGAGAERSGTPASSAACPFGENMTGGGDGRYAGRRRAGGR